MELIKQFIKNAKLKTVNIDSIIVTRNGKTTQRIINDIGLHELRSCSKLLIAMAYGIAINEKLQYRDGKTLTLQTKVYDTLTLHSTPPEQAKMWTIETLLTH